MAWSLSGPTQAADVKKISFACISNGSGSGSSSASPTKASTAVAQPSATKSTDASVAKPSSVKPSAVKPSAVAEAATSGESSALPEDAPRPSFATVPGSVTDVLSAPTEATSSAAAQKLSSVVVKPSAPSAEETDVPEDCDDEESGNSPVTTEAPVKTAPVSSEPTDSEDCDEEESGNAPVATQAPTKASKPKGRKTRTRTLTRFPRPTGLAAANDKKCVAKTVTHTVYVTATASAPGY
ncbi:hypothetical protein RAB80_002193 [Fusarium oxysporum f. sp. vasinfectum]|nr:hypothetical protein RAB80_002193 [Fusarium oxysporum f. sp. vasinfectum]KAK2922969.1 hypothetical protein FoTM2_017211 [Fusarium oxysporum f. sp. vasinfectum]